MGKPKGTRKHNAERARSGKGAPLIDPGITGHGRIEVMPTFVHGRHRDGWRYRRRAVRAGLRRGEWD